jgi:hypothetical protein
VIDADRAGHYIVKEGMKGITGQGEEQFVQAGEQIDECDLTGFRCIRACV